MPRKSAAKPASKLSDDVLIWDCEQTPFTPEVLMHILIALDSARTFQIVFLNKTYDNKLIREMVRKLRDGKHIPEMDIIKTTVMLRNYMLKDDELESTLFDCLIGCMPELLKAGATTDAMSAAQAAGLVRFFGEDGRQHVAEAASSGKK